MGVEIQAALQHLIDTAPNLNFTDAQICLMELYETKFGIRDHNVASASPFALVAMNEAEDPCFESDLYSRIEHFADARIHEVFGETLGSFLSYPRDVVLKMLDVAWKRKEATATSDDNVIKDLNARLGK